MPQKKRAPKDDPLWYKDAIIYELHVKTFCDSNGDGIGDFRGLISKLDYLDKLGITAIWLLPFYPSPLKDDGYDIADYHNINPIYGTLHHFKKLLAEAHSRGIRIITELVINHTSDQHEWFQRARRAKKGSVWRDFYVWSKSPDKFPDARIIFTDFESSNWTYDPVAGEYYWHRFYSHQPDLNYNNPRVQKAIFDVVDYWLDMGVDGMRLDAVPYLFEREDTNCENLPETHEFLKKLRSHVDRKYRNVMLLAEANQWPEDAAEYFGIGDECHMAFNFPVMPRMFMSIQMESYFPIADIFDPPVEIPESCQWAVFLRNHDELTLEMVTDEERDYMIRSYATDPKAKINVGIRRRLAPLLGNNRRKIELMNILLLSLPGTPVIYYGDELGMGDNFYLGDRDGVRTPMQWNGDRNAGFSRANPQSLYLPLIIDPMYHYRVLNAEVQDSNVSSLLWWMRRIIAIRKRNKAFGRGTIRFLNSNNYHVLSFVREYEDETILVVVNLSRFSQVAELDLSEFARRIPHELFSQNEFPEVSDNRPYTLTLGPHGHYWLRISEEKAKAAPSVEKAEFIIELEDIEKPTIPIVVDQLLQGALENYLQTARWFAAKNKTIKSIELQDTICISGLPLEACLLLINVIYREDEPQTYLMPVAVSFSRDTGVIEQEFPRAVIAKVKKDEHEGLVYDATFDYDFRMKMLEIIEKRKEIKSNNAILAGRRGRLFNRLKADNDENKDSKLMGTEQSNTSILYDRNFVLKIYRRIEGGINPDMELNRVLTEKAHFENIPAYAGDIEYRNNSGNRVTLSILQEYVDNRGDGWSFALEQAGRYYEHILTKPKELPEAAEAELDEDEKVIEFHLWTPQFHDMVGNFFHMMIELLGKRTAEMHRALSSIKQDKDFAPEKFSTLYQRSIYQSIRSQIRSSLKQLQAQYRRLTGDAKTLAGLVLDQQAKINSIARKIIEKKIDARKMRIHGDYHLGQVLFTGKDFVIIDFEGEPGHPLSERRIKRSPLRDVSGMLRSFHYAAYAGLRKNPSIRREDSAELETWAELWSNYLSEVYLAAYRDSAGGDEFLPKSDSDFAVLMRVYLLEKAAYEIEYELNNRPDWVPIPLKGILEVINPSLPENVKSTK